MEKQPPPLETAEGGCPMNAPIKQAPKHFLDLSDHDAPPCAASSTTPEAAKRPREGLPKGVADADAPLTGRVLAMIFDKQSTRTRISFDVGMRQLGGTTIMLTGNEMQLAREETIADTARVLSRYVDAVMIRLLDHEMVEELAANATIPVINGLTKLAPSLPGDGRCDDLRGAEGPDQGRHRRLERRWQQCADLLGACRRAASASPCASPRRRNSRPIRSEALGAGRQGRIRPLTRKRPSTAPTAWSPTPGCRWATRMPTKRHNLLKPYQVNARLMALAKKDAIFMHCLPAHRGEEVTDEVIDGPQSVVFDEAENRLHAQKAILAWALT